MAGKRRRDGAAEEDEIVSKVRRLYGDVDTWKTDKAAVIEVVAQDWKALRLADAKLQADKEVVLAAVTGGCGIVFADIVKAFLSDKEIMMVVINYDPCVLSYADETLRTDKEVIMTAVSQMGRALGLADKALRADKDVVMKAVSQDGEALEFADKAMQADKEVVMKAVTQNGDALMYADKALRADKDVVTKAVSQDGEALDFADKTLQADKEVVMKAVTQNGTALRFAAESLRRDRAVVMDAVRNSPDCELCQTFAMAHEDLQCDTSFVRTLLEAMPMKAIMAMQVTSMSGKSCHFLCHVLSWPLDVLRRSARLLRMNEAAVQARGELVLASTGAGCDIGGLGRGMHELQLIVRSE